MTKPAKFRRRARRLRDRTLRRSLGVDLRSLSDTVTSTRTELRQQRRLGEQVSRLADDVVQVREQAKHLDAELQRTHATLGDVQQRLASIETTLDGVRELVASARDNAPWLRHELQALRRSEDYALAFDDPDPLVTVRIASYRDTEALVGRAIPSVLRQTHQNFEIVIVNDGPNPATRDAVEALADPRIRYSEFPTRRTYPEDARHRWMVAGSPGMNEGAARARGRWIAPLDDDDEFSDDHLERLLQLARDERAELAYGAFDRLHEASGRHLTIFAYPPVLGGFTFQSAIYHAGLRFLDYDEESWRVDEPGDWNLCRRMLLAGVRVAATEEFVGTMYHVALHDKQL